MTNYWSIYLYHNQATILNFLHSAICTLHTYYTLITITNSYSPITVAWYHYITRLKDDDFKSLYILYCFRVYKSHPYVSEKCIIMLRGTVNDSATALLGEYLIPEYNGTGGTVPGTFITLLFPHKSGSRGLWPRKL